MVAFSDLPAEIRCMIHSNIKKDYEFDAKKPYTRAGYATVCREWQAVFEKENFAQVFLDQDRIFGLEQYMGQKKNTHRREHLMHLALRVRLNEYDCTVCQTKEDDATIKRNENVFSTAICALLGILSTWSGLKAQSHRLGRHQEGLTLELGVYSPSDCKHTFRDARLESDYPFCDIGDVILSPSEECRQRFDQLGIDTLNDPYHGWVDGCREGISLEAKQRVMGTLHLHSKRGATLPKVDIVTSLIIRRQYYRKIGIKSLNKLLRQTFTSLKLFRFENWYDADAAQQAKFEKDYQKLILKNIPTTLRQLSIFEDFSKVLNPERSTATIPANRSLGTSLSRSSRSLENLSASFLVDAMDFFIRFYPHKFIDPNTIVWENLKTLALTSPLLDPKTSLVRIDNLLMAAGRAAAFMPRLQTMEIWNGGEGFAYIFRYEYFSGEPEITLISTKPNLNFCAAVINTWMNLPQHRGLLHKLRVWNRPLKNRGRKFIKTPVAASRLLHLGKLVLNPLSQHQLACEEYEEIMKLEAYKEFWAKQLLTITDIDKDSHRFHYSRKCQKNRFSDAYRPVLGT